MGRKKLSPRMSGLGSRQEFGKVKRVAQAGRFAGQTRGEEAHPDEPRTVSHDDYA